MRMEQTEGKRRTLLCCQTIRLYCICANTQKPMPEADPWSGHTSTFVLADSCMINQIWWLEEHYRDRGCYQLICIIRLK